MQEPIYGVDCRFVDFDNDGFIDLYVTASDANHDIYVNDGFGTFTAIYKDGGFFAADARGVTSVDLLGNGKQCFYVTRQSGYSEFYEQAINENNWLSIELVPSASNESAIGTRVDLTYWVGEMKETMTRVVTAGSGWGSQGSTTADFGLGTMTKGSIYSLEVTWPSGTVQRIGSSEYDLNTVYQVEEITGNLDIVKFNSTDRHVEDGKEDEGGIGACLSLNRGANHLRPIYIRSCSKATGSVKLSWTSSKIEIYENANKTSKITSGKTYAVTSIPIKLYVEAVQRSNAKGDEKITLQYVPAGGGAVSDLDLIAFTNFEVEITLRLTQDDIYSAQSENDLRNAQVTELDNQDKLGLMEYTPSDEGGLYIYCGSIEIVGQLKPDCLRESDFTEQEFFWRQNWEGFVYYNDNDALKVQSEELDYQRDDPHTDWQDRSPSATGKIYTVDTPGAGFEATAQQSDILAARYKIKVWCTFSYQDEPMGCACTDTRNCPHIQKRADTPTCCYRVCSKEDKIHYLRVTIRNNGSDPNKWDEESCDDAKYFSTTAPTSPLNYGLKAPTVTSITPATGVRGTTVTITNLAGTVFVKDPTVVLEKAGCDSIQASDIVVDSKNKITCKFVIPADAETGDWNIKVTNPAVDDDGDGTKEDPKSSNTDKTFNVTAG